MSQYAIITFTVGDITFRLLPECLGINSMVSMVVLAVVHAILYQLRIKAAAVLLLSALALAIVQNAVRIAGIIAVSLVSYRLATGPVHDFLGYITFAVAALALFRIGDARRMD